MNDDQIFELKRLELLAQINIELMGFADRYQQLVFGMIYAAFFALWLGLDKTHLSPTFLLAGALMLISVLTYGLWIIFTNNILLKKKALAVEQLRVATDINLMIELEEAARIGQENKKIMKYQPAMFYFTVATGLSGVFTLLFIYIHGLTHHMVW